MQAYPRVAGRVARRQWPVTAGVTLTLALLLGGMNDPAARAAPATPSQQAEAKGKVALGHFMKGDFEQAVKLYHEAHALAREVKYLYNIGLCYYKLNRWDEALRAFQDFAKHAGENPYVEGAAKRIREIQRTTSLVTFTVTPAGARVMVDDRAPVVAPVADPIRLRNGRHTLLVTHADHVTVRRTFNVSGDRNQVVKVSLQTWSGGRPVTPPPRPDPPRMPVPDPPRRLVEGPRVGAVIPPTPPPELRPGEGPGRATTEIDRTRPDPPASPGALPGPPATGAPKRNPTWLAVGITGTALLLVGEITAWAIWGAYQGGDKASKTWPGYLYYAGHGLAALGAGAAILGYALYFKLTRPERSAAGPGAAPRIIPLLSAGPGSAFLGLRGTF